MAFIFLLTSCSRPVCSQIITVMDSLSGDPLELAVLTSNATRNIVMTNSDGQADISSFINAAGIEIRSLGYKTVRSSYTDLEAMKFVIRLQREEISLDQVVVSGSKWSQGSREIPSRITSISAREITLQNPQTAADMLGISGEVFIQKSQQGGGSPMLRGFSTNRLLYVIDGVRMNTAIFRSGNLQNIISLDPFSIESAEVLFGPGSVIYGSDAIGGVMHFATITPQLSFTDETLITGKGVARYSSANNEFTGHFDITTGWKKWALVTSITSSDYKDLRMGSHGPDEYLRPFYVQRVNEADQVIANHDPRLQTPSGYAQINFMEKVLFVPGPQWELGYNFHYSETSPYSRYDRHIRYKDGKPRYGEWDYGPQKWMMNHFKVHHKTAHKYYDQMTLNMALQHFEESRIDRDIQDSVRHIRQEKVYAYSLNLDFAKSLRSNDQLYYGLEGVVNDVRSTGIDENILTAIERPGPSRYPQATWSSYGAYVNYLMRIHNRLTLQGGLRYSLFDLDAVFDTSYYPFPFTEARIQNNAVTGSLGFVLSPTAKWTFSVNFATGFRSPNVDDAGKVFDSAPGFVIVPNPDLSAEYAYNFEAGFARILGRNIKVDITGYYTLLKNALVRRDFTLNGADSIMYNGELSRVQAMQNAAKANVYGLQAGLEVKLPSGFGITTDLNYQVGEEEGDDGITSPSRHAAPFFGMASVRYNESNLSLMLYTQFSAMKSYEDLPPEEQAKTELYATDHNGNPFSPAWYTLNFKASIHFEKNFTITSGLENITDVRYRPYSSGLAGAGRNFTLAIRLGF